MLHVDMNKSHVEINKSHVNIIMVHVDINKSPVNIIMLHVDIIYLALRGQKYAIISLPCRSCLFCLSWFYRMGFFTWCLFQQRCIMSHQNLTFRYLLGRFYSVSAAVSAIIQSLGPDIGLYILSRCSVRNGLRDKPTPRYDFARDNLTPR